MRRLTAALLVGLALVLFVLPAPVYAAGTLTPFEAGTLTNGNWGMRATSAEGTVSLMMPVTACKLALNVPVGYTFNDGWISDSWTIDEGACAGTTYSGWIE